MNQAIKAIPQTFYITIPDALTPLKAVEFIDEQLDLFYQQAKDLSDLVINPSVVVEYRSTLLEVRQLMNLRGLAWLDLYLQEYRKAKDLYSELENGDVIDVDLTHMAPTVSSATKMAITTAMTTWFGHVRDGFFRGLLKRPLFVFKFKEIEIPLHPFDSTPEGLCEAYMNRVLEEVSKGNKVITEENKMVEKYQKLLDNKTTDTIISIQRGNLTQRANEPFKEYMVLVLYWLADIINLSSQEGVIFHNRKQMIHMLESLNIRDRLATTESDANGDCVGEFDEILGMCLYIFRNPNQDHSHINAIASKWIKDHIGENVNTFDRTMNQVVRA